MLVSVVQRERSEMENNNVDIFEEEWKTGTENDYWVRTCAWSAPGCHPTGCGLKLHVKDGKLVEVEGDENHHVSQGRLCVRCLTLPEYIYHPDRVIYPMKRARENRGLNKWERISWDEALDIIEEKCNELQGKYGRETVAVFSGTGREATLYGPAMASAVFRTPYHVFAMSGQACYGPRNAVASSVYGSIGYPEVDYAAAMPGRYDDPDYTLSECIVLWGKNPLPSNPDGMFGHAIVDMIKRGSKLICVDPRVTWIGSRADIVLQLRNGTDAAMAMAICNIIIQEDLYDHEFIENWAYGFEEFSERMATMPADKAAEICGVPAEKIIAAARMIGTSKPCSFAWGLAFDQQLTGGQAGQCFMCLIAMTGNMDVPGGNTCGAQYRSALGQWRVDTQKCLDPGVFQNRIGSKEYPLFAIRMFSTQPDKWLEAREADSPVHFSIICVQSSNFLAPSCGNEPERWYRALKDIEFGIGTDLFITPTIQALCDVFLPVATFAEHVGLVQPYYGSNMAFMGAMNKAIDVGETKSDIEINMAIGKRLNPEAWPWETADDFFEEQCFNGLGIHFKDLQNDVCHVIPYTYKKYEKGLQRPDGYPGFNSPTSMVEFSSTMFEQFGEDPLPYYKPCPYAPVKDAPQHDEKYPLFLTTGGRKYTSFHSEHRMIKTLREIDPWPIVQVNPVVAEAYNLTDGAWATIENMFGKCNMKVEVTPCIREDVVHCTHGWWFPEQDGEEPNLYGVWKANVNKLIPNEVNNPLGYGSVHKSMCCTVYPANGLDD
jgi:anaerobic selenocysteine-containing dehydrogenase